MEEETGILQQILHDITSFPMNECYFIFRYHFKEGRINKMNTWQRDVAR